MFSLKEILHSFVWAKRHRFNQYSVSDAKLLVPYIKSTDILIDIGAHGGSWTVILSRLVPNGKVYAIEALPYYYRVLKLTLRILGLSNVELINKAVLDEIKQIQIVCRNNKGLRLTGRIHIKAPGENAMETVSVDGTRLDDLLNQVDGKVRFIKIDIEGAELFALRGASQLISKHRPLLFVELYEEYCQRYKYKPEEVFDFFSNLKYGSYQHDNNNTWVQIKACNYSGKGDVWFIPIEQVSSFVGQE